MSRRLRTLLIASSAVLLVVILSGLTRIPYPFTHDQAFFTLGAKAINGGAVLYRDFWDVKQPGIFWFYVLGGSLFGFTEVGIYTFELLYLLVFSIILILTLARYFSSPFLAASLPLFTVAFYYGVAGHYEKAQLEPVVGFPLYLMLWFALRAEESKSLSPFFLFLSGLWGGIVLLFKSFFLPILLAIWLPTIYSGNKKCQTPDFRLFSRSVLYLLGGAALPLLITSFYFAIHGTLDQFLWTTFVYPSLVVSELGHSPFYHLVNGHQWFFRQCGSSLALAVVALFPVASRRLDPLNRNLLLWITCGFVVIQLQVRSWYSWHYALLFVPLGILAARGIDDLWSHALTHWGRLGRAQLALWLTMVVCFLYVSPILRLTLDTIILLRNGIPITAARVREIQRGLNDQYTEIEQEVRFLSEPASVPGPIYVFGNNHLYELISRREAILFTASLSPLRILPDQQELLLDRLRLSRPSYILVSPEGQLVIDKGFRSFQTFLEDHYREFRRSRAGIWYAVAQRVEPQPA